MKNKDASGKDVHKMDREDLILLRKIVVLVFISMLCLLSLPNYTYANNDWQQLPDGICARYAAQEFEKIAPPPGVNWLSENRDWVLHADQAGWVVKLGVREAMPGAVIEWNEVEQGSGAGGHVAIVRQVLADKIIVEQMNSGKTTGERVYTFGGKKLRTEVTDGWGIVKMQAITYDKLLMLDKRKFAGYIWPVRKDDYAKNPAKYDISVTDQMNQKEPRYKGFREFWSFTYMLKEFDKVAPAPGVDWQGGVGQWLVNAQKGGWITKNDPQSPLLGALLIRENYEKKLYKVGIVRSIQGDEITIDTRYSDLYPITQTLKISELSKDPGDYQFIGYIWPVKENGDALKGA